MRRRVPSELMSEELRPLAAGRGWLLKPRQLELQRPAWAVQDKV